MSTKSEFNGKCPAFPTDVHDGPAYGFTKREAIAKDLLAAMTSKYTMSAPADQRIMSRLAVELADTLLDVLSDPNG